MGKNHPNKTDKKLARIYAKCKLQEALDAQKFCGSTAPAEIEQLEYLVEEYYFALEHLSNQAD